MTEDMVIEIVNDAISNLSQTSMESYLFAGFPIILTALLTYIFTVRGKNVDRRNKVDDNLVKRKIKVYEKAESIARDLTNSEIVVCDWTKCEVYKSSLYTRMGQRIIPYTRPLYNDVDKIEDLNKRIREILSDLTLINEDLVKWLNLLHMYNDNLILIHKTKSEQIFSDLTVFFPSTNEEINWTEDDEKTIGETLVYKYLLYSSTFDVELICERIVNAISKFYSSSNKTKIKKLGIVRNYFNMSHMHWFARKFRIRGKRLRDKDMKRFAACLRCKENCTLAGKMLPLNCDE